MRKTVLTVVAAIWAATAVFGQQGPMFRGSSDPAMFLIIYNESPRQADWPVMVGLVNNARGDNSGVQAGLLNYTGGRQAGLQMGLLNAALKDVAGAQLGLINLYGADQRGALFGLVNGVVNNVRGAQFGVMNIFAGYTKGAGFGVVNLSGELASGARFGVANFSLNDAEGFQMGALNYSRNVSGLQFGVINIAESYERGAPFGLLNITRRGGYHAVEIGTDGLFPVRLAVKTGVEKFYTSIIGGYDPSFHDQFALGAGLGTIVAGERRLFFNPEVNYLSTFGDRSASFFELHPNVGWMLGDGFSLIAAPTLSWQNTGRQGVLNDPLWSLATISIDRRNEIYAGLRVALRYNFGWR